jgi:hypothetical protein
MPISGAAVPGIPTDLITIGGMGTVKLSWTAPSGGSNIDYYIIYQNGVDVSHTSITSTTITGLTNGENYSFAVAAHNSGGVGTQSAAQNIAPGASATTSSGLANIVIYTGVLAILAIAIIAIIFAVRRRGKKE